MKKSGRFSFITGFALGAAMFGGAAAFAAAGILAQPGTAAVVIDGREADIKGYVIEGSHYFQLRDLDAKLMSGGKDFSVVWDDGGNRVVIDTARRYDPNERYVPPAAAPAMTIDEMRAEIVRLTNAERTKTGLPEVEVLPALMACAQAKADDMGKNGYRHVSPVYGTAGEMIRAAIPEMTSCAENLAPWTKTPEEAFAGWVESPPHYANIINQKYTHIGVGVLKGAGGGYWWVLQLIRL
jgi:hypothetical protein